MLFFFSVKQSVSAAHTFFLDCFLCVCVCVVFSLLLLISFHLLFNLFLRFNGYVNMVNVFNICIWYDLINSMYTFYMHTHRKRNNNIALAID